MAQSEDDETTVQRLLRGDEDAFAQVYAAIQPGLLRYLTAMVGPADAEDVAAEAWTQVIRDLGRFRGGADGFRGWVTRIARNRALDLLRRSGRQPMAGLPVEELGERDELIDPGRTEDQTLVLISTEEALRLIGTLSPDQAEAVLLRAVVGLDAKTAGEVLGKRAGAVRTAAYRGLKALAKKISAEE